MLGVCWGERLAGDDWEVVNPGLTPDGPGTAPVLVGRWGDRCCTRSAACFACRQTVENIEHVTTYTSWHDSQDMVVSIMC